jgi:hypothetical protein
VLISTECSPGSELSLNPCLLRACCAVTNGHEAAKHSTRLKTCRPSRVMVMGRSYLDTRWRTEKNGDASSKPRTKMLSRSPGSLLPIRKRPYTEQNTGVLIMFMLQPKRTNRHLRFSTPPGPDRHGLATGQICSRNECMALR